MATVIVLAVDRDYSIEITYVLIINANLFNLQ